MAAYTLKVRRYQPEYADGKAEGAYWEEFDVELDETLSVLDGLLQVRDRQDGTLVVRCSCKAAICGSCGTKINGQSTLACKTQIAEAQQGADRRATNGIRNRSTKALTLTTPSSTCSPKCRTTTAASVWPARATVRGSQ